MDVICNTFSMCTQRLLFLSFLSVDPLLKMICRFRKAVVYSYTHDWFQASTEVGQLQSMLAVVQQEKNQCQEEMRLQAAGWNQRWEEASKKAESQGAELVNALQRLAEREQQLQQLEFASQVCVSGLILSL